MLIGYDGRFIAEGLTGNGIYALRLIETLSRVDDRNFYRLYLPGPNAMLPPGLEGNVEIKEMHPLHRSAWVRVPITFPLELRRRPVDCFHAHYTIPARTRCKVVLTLHDFSWIVYPDHFIARKRIPLTYTVRKAVARADRILVGTPFIKRETMEYFDVPEERFAVIPYGVDARFFRRASAEERETVLKKYGVDGPYVLAVGDLHPRKNLERLLEAFIALEDHDHVKLVLVGKPLWKTTALFDRIKSAGLEARVVTTGYVPNDELPILYQCAEVFCYPSLYEGFGFPTLEGMAAGVPTAVSNASSCPDVGGDAALYFDPLKPESIAATLHRALTDSALRERHVAAGLARARGFTWEETARRTMDVYRSLE
ncbi:MAG: glycosyltransferase family 4 protein [Candidatus Methylomirabilis sp.]|nr:glycosyltransferase family 4 protein [Deltaproteobacteria bacterium]